jgi:protein CsiD
MQEFVVGYHPVHPRLKQIRLVSVPEFMSSCNCSNAEIKRMSEDWLGCHPTFTDFIRTTLTDREFGGLTIEMQPNTLSDCDDALAMFAEAIAERIGDILPEDRKTHGTVMQPQNYVTIPLRHGIDQPGRQMHFTAARLAWPLHTDRALKEDAGDFLLIVKATESGGTGGRIRLLHIDDFTSLQEFVSDPLAFEPLGWGYDTSLAPQTERFQLRSTPVVRAPVFTLHNGQLCIRYTDPRFRRPGSVEQAQFLAKLESAIASDASNVPAFNLPVHGIYMVNNRWILHGREGFTTTDGFERRLLRLCGNLATE